MNKPRSSKDRLPTYTPAEGVTPICPHCEAAIEGLYQQRIDEPLGKAFIWFCMNCRRSLGVSHRKGFWMG